MYLRWDWAQTSVRNSRVHAQKTPQVLHVDGWTHALRLVSLRCMALCSSSEESVAAGSLTQTASSGTWIQRLFCAVEGGTEQLGAGRRVGGLALASLHLTWAAEDGMNKLDWNYPRVVWHSYTFRNEHYRSHMLKALAQLFLWPKCAE